MSGKTKVPGHGRGPRWGVRSHGGPQQDPESAQPMEEKRFFRAQAVNTAGHRVWLSGPG